MLDVYRTLLKTAIAVQLQYRASGAIWMIFSILDPVVFLVVWSTVARSQGGEVEGFTPREFAAYYIALMVVNHATFTWIMHEFQWRIREGHMSFLLLRPLHPIHEDLADNLAYKLVMMFVMLPAALVLALLFRPDFSAPAWALAAFVPTLIGAFVVRFLLGWAMALAAFWTTRTDAMNQIYFALLLLLSGRIAPVELLPEWLEWTSRALPFYWMAAFPVEVLLGRVSPGAAAEGLAIQLAWTAALLVVLVFTWRLAVRHYSAVGG